MLTTIKDIAKKAGVSVATVSHVINRTRYVSPELVKKVEEVIDGSDYRKKIEKKEKNMLIGKQSTIAVVVPFIVGTLYTKLVTSISEHLVKEGYLLSVYCTNNDFELEKLILNRVVEDKKIAGIILSPCRMEEKDYTKLFARNIPVVFLERSIKGRETDSVLAENKEAVYRGTRHLIKSGHEKVAVLLGEVSTSTVVERLEGYKQALSDSGIFFDRQKMLSLSHVDKKSHMHKIREFYLGMKPSAIICCGNQLTLMLLKTLQYMGLDCPQDISVIGFGDEEWCELIIPPLTVLKQDTEKMGYYAAKKMLSKLQEKLPWEEAVRVPLELMVRKSTQMIGRGPFGEKAFSPDDIILTEGEKEQLLKSDFKVGISFHYSGTAWKRLHESGIRQTLENLGITVVSVTDAHFDPELQVTQLEGIEMQHPDAIIAIPTDDNVTAGIFKKLSKETKLIFLSNVPEGLKTEDYVSCVSVNERENGHIVGTLMGEYFKDQKKISVGFINHGASFYGTHLRDAIATQAICENYSNIEIAAVNKFQNIEDTYKICKSMMQKHPEIKGLYVSWDRPALGAIRALEELGREDVAVFTFDLDKEICSYLVQGRFVKGMSTQKPYEQGVAVALATAKALLGNNEYKYIGVPPCVVQKKNLVRAWKDIMHEAIPQEWEAYLE